MAIYDQQQIQQIKSFIPVSHVICEWMNEPNGNCDSSDLLWKRKKDSGPNNDDKSIKKT